MTDLSPQENWYRLEAAGGGGTAYVLPQRRLVTLPWIVAGWAMGGMFLLIPSAIGIGSITAAFAPGGSPFAVVGALFVLPFIAVGLFLVGVVWSLRWGATRVTVRSGEIIAEDSFGPFAWRRRLSAREIGQFVVMKGGAEVNNRPVTEGPWAEAAALIAKPADPVEAEAMFGGSGGRRGGARKLRWVLALLYPASLLEALASELSARVGVDVGTFEVPIPVITVEADGTTGPDEVVEQPASSDAEIIREPGHITIRIPPAGWKGTKGLAFFAVVWNGFIAIFVGGFAFGLVTGGGGSGGSSLFIAAVIGVFVVVGVLMARFAMEHAKRTTVLDVLEGDVIVTRKGVGKVKTWTFLAQDIERVELGPSGMEVNDKPIYELQFHVVGPDGKSKKHGFLSERSDDEIRWIASEIRAFMPSRAHTLEAAE